MQFFLQRISLIFFAIFLASAPVHACPSLSGIPDFNCDQDIKITFLGDSLVYGIGDTANGNKGGYPLRLQRSLPFAKIVNLGEPGLFAGQLLRQLIKALTPKGNSAIKSAVLTSDIVVIDVGRNDRWLFGLPLATFRDLKRIRTLIADKSEKLAGSSPLVVTAVLMLPNRGSQGPWVLELNKLILSGNSKTFPSDLRFDLVSKRLLSADQVHPTPEGYNSLASTARNYITKTLPKRMLKLRPDRDNDGIFDIFELSRFGTDPTLADTDGDGVNDGREVFVLKTDPLS